MPALQGALHSVHAPAVPARARCARHARRALRHLAQAAAHAGHRGRLALCQVPREGRQRQLSLPHILQRAPVRASLQGAALAIRFSCCTLALQHLLPSQAKARPLRVCSRLISIARRSLGQGCHAAPL